MHGQSQQPSQGTPSTAEESADYPCTPPAIADDSPAEKESAEKPSAGHAEAEAPAPGEGNDDEESNGEGEGDGNEGPTDEELCAAIGLVPSWVEDALALTPKKVR